MDGSIPRAAGPAPLDSSASVYYYCSTVTSTVPLRVDPAAAAPLWSQIEDGVRRLVASGTLAPAAAVPSVRDLARQLRVNPATVSKAYQRLTDTGVLEVRRGDGTYVSADPPSVPRGRRLHALREAALRYASIAVTCGANRDEAIEGLRAAWADLTQGKKGNTA
jgi:DNA-binding transcriptional regulator YhcF (GntR family)